MSRAEDTFRLWHSKDPRKEFRRRVKYLDGDFARIGLASEIQYRSDKWERDGDHYPYVHDFGRSVGVYVPASAVSDEDIIGALNSGHRLLGIRGRGNTAEVAQLGTCEELVFRDASNEEVVLAFPKGTLLLSSPDRKALIIVDKSRPIIVRGGKMSVQSRGIVN